MRVHVSLLVSGFALISVIVAGSALADGSWAGPGWYVEETATGFDATLFSGPYTDEARCKAALPADTDDYSYDCIDEETDPTTDSPPQTRTRATVTSGEAG